MTIVTLKTHPPVTAQIVPQNNSCAGKLFNEICFKIAGLDPEGHDLPAIEILAEMGVKISRQDAMKVENHFLYDTKSGRPYLVVTGNVAGEVVAAATISINEPLSGEFSGKKILEIAKLAVDEKYQGKGLGKLLVKNIEENAEFHGCQVIVAATVTWRSAAFWSDLGFEPAKSSYGRLSPDGYYPGYKDFCKSV